MCYIANCCFFLFCCCHVLSDYLQVLHLTVLTNTQTLQFHSAQPFAGGQHAVDLHFSFIRPQVLDAYFCLFSQLCDALSDSTGWFILCGEGTCSLSTYQPFCQFSSVQDGFRVLMANPSLICLLASVDVNQESLSLSHGKVDNVLCLTADHLG